MLTTNPTLTLIAPLPSETLRVLAASIIDGVSAEQWLNDPQVASVRKACLLNILAVLSVTPTAETPLIGDVLAVFTVRAERVHAVLRSAVRETLDDFVKDIRMPFYRDSRPPLGIHRGMLDDLPELIAAAFQPYGPKSSIKPTALISYRAEGAPSLQIVLADSPYPITVADLDLDEHNPKQDVVGFIGHMRELIRTDWRDRATDHLRMRATLSRGPAGAYLGYTLSA